MEKKLNSFEEKLERNKKLLEQVRIINDELTEEVKQRAEGIVEGAYVV